MKSKKPTKKDQLWGKAIEKRVEAAKLNLDHPDGQKRFKNVMRNAELVFSRKLPKLASKLSNFLGWLQTVA